MNFEVTMHEMFIDMVSIPHKNNIYEITICQVLV